MRVDFTSSHQELWCWSWWCRSGQQLEQYRDNSCASPNRPGPDQKKIRPILSFCLASCRWCCQEQVSQIIFYVLGGSSLGAEYCLLIWWQKAHNREFTEKLWWRLCLVGLSYPKDHGGMWTIFRLAEISVRSRCQKWWKYWKRRGFRNFFCHLPVDNCFSMDFCPTPKIWACE